MSSPTPARHRLHPAALAAVIGCAALVVGALVFLAWFLTSTSSDQDASPTADATASANTEATQRLLQWKALFDAYRGAHGAFPDLPDGGYCLGSGFPVGAGDTANCRDYQATNFYTEEASAPLMQALSSAGDLPTGTSEPVRGTVGPYALYEGGTITLLTAENGTCVAPAVDVWTDGGGLHICTIKLDR